MSEKFANQRAATTLDGAILAADTTLVVDDASGLPDDGVFRIILGQGAQAEIVQVGAISGTTLTDLTRGSEGTTPRNWPNNTALAHILTAGGFDAGMSDKVTAHEAAGDPHPGYETATESQAKVDTHSADTTAVHGITDTSALSTTTASHTYTDTQIATHEADTTNVHGVTNTASLETTTGAQTKADTAQSTAISTSETYADTGISTHAGLPDPHTAYLKESELGRTYNVRSVTTGTSDDTAAIQGLHDAASDGDTIFVQPGTYTIDQLNWTKKVNIIGQGTPEQVVFKAKSGATGPLLNVAFASLKHHLRIENLYIDLTAATGIIGLYLNNVDFGRIQFVKVREGTVAFDLDLVQGVRFDQCLAFNQRTSGYRVKNASAIGNTFVDCKYFMTSGAAADCTVAAFDFQNGASHYLIGCEVLRTPGISFNLPYGVYLHSPATTDWLFMTSCYIDGVTDGTPNSASSAGLYALDSNSIFLANCFFSANDSSGKKERGIRLDGCSYVSVTGGRISGSGMEFRNTCDTIAVSAVSFPAAYSDAAFNFGASTTTNLSYNIPPPGGAIADDNALLSTATASTKGYMGGGKRILVSDAHIAESLILEHASTGKKKHLRVLSGATGVFEILADNGTTKILQLLDSGRLLIGNNSTNAEITGGGTPEGVATATVGSTYRRTDGGASTTFYVKESGTGNTGWVAYGPSTGGSNQDAMLTKAGAVSDADFTTPTSGQFGFDTTNHRLYIRDGSTWRYVEVN